MSNPIVNGDTFTKGDIIRRRWLDNHFYGAVFSLNYQNKKLDWIVGGGQHFYDGGHYGEVISAQRFPADFKAHRYYENNAFKTMGNLYTKAIYELYPKVTLYGDAQVRRITYTSEGPDNDGLDTKLDVNYTFFNPKAGINYSLNQTTGMYLTYGRSNREPVRGDLINSSNISRPKPNQHTRSPVGDTFAKEKGHTTNKNENKKNQTSNKSTASMPFPNYLPSDHNTHKTPNSIP